MSKKNTKILKTYTINDLYPRELKARLTAQDFFNTFEEHQNSEWKVLLDESRIQDVDGSSVYLEIICRLDINKLKNLAFNI